MNKGNDERDEFVNEFEQQSELAYRRLPGTPPKSMADNIKAHARSARAPQPYAQDEFFPMAAAERSDNPARELTSQSGEWTLRIYEDIHNRDQGYVVLEVSAQRAADFNGRSAKLEFGGRCIDLGLIRDGEAEAELSLANLSKDQVFSLKIE